MKEYGQTSEDNQDSGVLSNPISFVRNGYVLWYSGTKGGFGIEGNYWTLYSTNTSNSNALYFRNTYLYPQNYYARGYGSMRCVA